MTAKEDRMDHKRSYYLYGSPDVRPETGGWPEDLTPDRLYAALSQVWSQETCAPRLRSEWTPENRTVGQCSVTAFLAQDVFGGTVFGIPLGDGRYHCYNRVGETVFDLTSEQFLPELLTYACEHPQSRETHFASEEKYRRYLALD